MFAHNVSATIDRHDMARPGDRILVGISGGADSVALALVLDELGFEIVLAHLDHGLREDASDDAEFCRRLAERLGATFVTDRADVATEARAGRLSVEDAGRRARYRFFRREAARLGCGRVAVGHTRDDQAETVLMRLVRGSGTGGLSGAPPVRGAIVRPLFERRRREVESYLRDKGEAHREDPTNRDLRFARNRTRHELLPAIERGFNPRITETLARTAELLREDEAWMASAAQAATDELVVLGENGATLSAKALSERHPALARRVVRNALTAARGRGDDIGLAHVESVLELARRGRSGSELHLPGVVVARSFDELRFCPGSGRDPRRRGKRVYNGYEYRLPIPADVPIPESAGTLSARSLGMARFGGGRDDKPSASGNRVVVGLDLEGRRAELSVRSPRRGDRFRPLGAPGSKPLNRYLMEQKVSREHRCSVPVVVSAAHDRRDDEILWVVGHAISESARRSTSGLALELTWVSA